MGIAKTANFSETVDEEVCLFVPVTVPFPHGPMVPRSRQGHSLANISGFSNALQLLLEK